MAPPYRKLSTDPFHTRTHPAEPRPGGMVTYRKPGQTTKYALIEWVYPDGSMRVRPDRGARQIIDATDVARADKLARKLVAA